LWARSVAGAGARRTSVRSQYEEGPAQDSWSGCREVGCWGRGVVGVGDEVRFLCEGDGGCSAGQLADVAEEV